MSMDARPPNQNGVRAEEPPNNHHNISPVVQDHLMKVYFLLCCASLVTATGSCLPLLWNPGALITTLAAVGSIVGLVKTPLTEQKVRIALLMTAAIFLGASIHLLFDLVTPVETSFLIRGLMGVAIAFACFSAAATRSTWPAYIYIGGCCSSGALILFWWFVFAFIFGQLTALMNIMLYAWGWGMLFMGYTVLETQKIIQKAESGDLDYVVHAVAFFFDPSFESEAFRGLYRCLGDRLLSHIILCCVPIAAFSSGLFAPFMDLKDLLGFLVLVDPSLITLGTEIASGFLVAVYHFARSRMHLTGGQLWSGFYILLFFIIVATGFLYICASFPFEQYVLMLFFGGFLYALAFLLHYTHTFIRVSA